MPPSANQPPNHLKLILAIGVLAIAWFSFFNPFSPSWFRQLATPALLTPTSFFDDYDDLSYYED